MLEVTRDGLQVKMQKSMKLQESFSRQRAKAGLKRQDKLVGQYYEQGSGMCEPPKRGSQCEDYSQEGTPCGELLGLQLHD